MLGYPIAKPIRKKLDEKIKISNRDTDIYQPTSADSKNKYLKNSRMRREAAHFIISEVFFL